MASRFVPKSFEQAAKIDDSDIPMYNALSMNQFRFKLPKDVSSCIYHSHVERLLDHSIAKGERKMNRKMSEILGRLRSVTSLIQELSGITSLHQKCLSWISCKVGKKYKDNYDPRLLKTMTIPYLYLATIETLLQNYDHHINNEPIRSESLFDVDRVVRYVKENNLPGVGLIVFMKSILESIINVNDALCTQRYPNLLRFNPLVGEYLLHASFIMRVPTLFKTICNSIDVSRVLSDDSILSSFDWEELTNDGLNKKNIFTFGQSYRGLKMRKEAARAIQQGPDYLIRDCSPLSPRQLTTQMVHDAKTVAGESAADEQNRQLNNWDYLDYQKKMSKKIPPKIPDINPIQQINHNEVKSVTTNQISKVKPPAILKLQ